MLALFVTRCAKAGNAHILRANPGLTHGPSALLPPDCADSVHHRKPKELEVILPHLVDHLPRLWSEVIWRHVRAIPVRPCVRVRISLLRQSVCISTPFHQTVEVLPEILLPYNVLAAPRIAVNRILVAIPPKHIGRLRHKMAIVDAWALLCEVELLDCELIQTLRVAQASPRHFSESCAEGIMEL